MSSDSTEAKALDEARGRLMVAGAEGLAPRPWQRPEQPPADVDLVRFAAWVAREPDVDGRVLGAGLHLLESARSELDQIETALLFAARAAGLTWTSLADALGLRSAQAAQQRHHRVAARASDGG